MSHAHGTRSRLAVGLIVSLLTAALLTSPHEAAARAAAVPDPDRNSIQPTGWGWHTNVTPAVVKDFVDLGNRIVDLEVNSSAPKFSVSYVPNSGVFARAWWWYYGKTGAQVKSLLAQNKARLIDIEPYATGAGTRYAVVMVGNSGVAKKTWGWHYNVPLSTITDYVDDQGMRVIDVDRNPGGNRFSAVYIKNAGVDAKGWWHYYNVTSAKIKDLLKEKKARIINLERRSATRFDVVMQKRSGEPWWWLLNVSATGLSRAADQLGARIFQVKSRVVNGKRRYDAVLINAANKETRRIRNLVTDQMTNDWGFYLKKVNGPTLLGLGANNTFEPASMIKIVHAVTAMREMMDEPTIDENTLVTWYANPAFPARYPGDPGYRTPNIQGDTEHADVCAYDSNGNLLTGSTYSDAFGSVILTQTLVQSDNRTTDALLRRYGFGGVNATADLAGMTNTEVNHRINCANLSSPQPLTHNWLTLVDAGKLYEQVQNLTLLDAAHRNLLYSYLPGGVLGNGPTRNMIIDEANDAGLTTDERNEFLALVEIRSKGGSYGYCPDFTGQGLLPCNPPSVASRTVGGMIWLPFKAATRQVRVPYVFGRYFDSSFNCTGNQIGNANCTGFNNNQTGMATVAVEMFRAEVKKALATW